MSGVLNLATVDGACQTTVNLMQVSPGHFTAVYGCECSFSRSQAKGSMHGQGTLSTLGTFTPGAVLSYSLDRPISVEIVDCNYNPATVFAVLSSLSFTVTVTNDTVNLQDPPGPQRGILITNLSATLAPVDVCGQDWGVSFVSLDPAALALALGFVNTTSGDIEFPANMAATVTNDVYGAGSPLHVYGYLGGHVDVGMTNGLTFVLSLNPQLAVHPADLNVDGSVGIVDMLLLLANWGPCPAPCPPKCGADINGDCNVNVVDFLALLAAWGP